MQGRLPDLFKAEKSSDEEQQDNSSSEDLDGEYGKGEPRATPLLLATAPQGEGKAQHGETQHGDVSIGKHHQDLDPIPMLPHQVLQPALSAAELASSGGQVQPKLEMIPATTRDTSQPMSTFNPIAPTPTVFGIQHRELTASRPSPSPSPARSQHWTGSALMPPPSLPVMPPPSLPVQRKAFRTSCETQDHPGYEMPGIRQPNQFVNAEFNRFLNATGTSPPPPLLHPLCSLRPTYP
jgi:hypothetical protein